MVVFFHIQRKYKLFEFNHAGASPSVAFVYLSVALTTGKYNDLPWAPIFAMPFLLTPDLVFTIFTIRASNDKKRIPRTNQRSIGGFPFVKKPSPEGGALVFYATKERGAKEIWSLPSQRLSRNGEEFLLCLFVFLSVGSRIRTL